MNWGSSGQAHTYRKALQLAHTLNVIEDHVKNFRPQCLVMTGLPSSRSDLVHFVSYLTKHVGLMVCGQVTLSKDGIDIPAVNQDKWLRRNKIKAFHVIASGMISALPSLSKISSNFKMFKAIALNTDCSSIKEANWNIVANKALPFA